MIYIGIDPGKSGACAYTLGNEMYTFKFSDTEHDIYARMSNAFANNDDKFALIEKVHAMPKQGVTSSFTFGRNYGFLRGCLTALRIPFEEISPQRWQKAIGCMSKGDKNVTKAKAQNMFPCMKITHAIADAILIAEYAKRLHMLRKAPGVPLVETSHGG